MKKNTLNICQVSLSRDIPIILENYKNLKKFYHFFKIFVICPTNELQTFSEKLDYDEFEIICEDDIISLNEFKIIFEELSVSLRYKEEFKQRLKWYYQQILKLSFVLNFVNKKKRNIIIWDADTIILKKIDFFKNNYSIKYGTFFEFHKPYYVTNKSIIGEMPRYFISSLIQFSSITERECIFLLKNFISLDEKKEKLSSVIAKVILKNIFEKHEIYNGSLFSEYELIGISNYILNKTKKKSIFTLRSGLDGKLTNMQKKIAKLFNTIHVTYEHSYLNKNSQGMLDRSQNWFNFLKIISKSLFKFHLRNIRHNFNFYYYSIRFRK